MSLESRGSDLFGKDRKCQVCPLRVVTRELASVVDVHRKLISRTQSTGQTTSDDGTDTRTDQVVSWSTSLPTTYVS